MVSSRQAYTRSASGADSAPISRSLAGPALEELRRLSGPPPFPREILLGVAQAVEAIWGVLAGFAAFMFFAPGAAIGPYLFALPLIVLSPAIAALQSGHLYSIPAFWTPVRPFLRFAASWAAVLAAIWALTHGLQLPSAPSAAFLVGWLIVVLGGVGVARIALAVLVTRLAKSGRLERRVAVVGGGEFAEALLRDLSQAHPAELRLLGVFDDRGDDRAPAEIGGLPKLGNVDDLVNFARKTRVDLIIFALPITAEARLQPMLRKLWVLPADIRLAAHASRVRLRPRAYSYIGSAPLLDVFDKPLGEWDVVFKATFDRVIGALALIMLSPPMLIAALAVKLDSRGPIFFRQQRYGFNNEVIEVYKFRSMRVDKLDPQAVQLVTRDDPRVTRVGRFLRRTSIDELPQLFNVVFKGDLSLVGPRPHAMHAAAADRQYDQVVESYFARHRVKPGLTGWAQIRGWRGETDTPEKIQQRVEHDLYYIENWTMLFDLYILAMTPWALLCGENAY
jgi:Undecaprenyl-phosphate glucose phosphotransferase